MRGQVDKLLWTALLAGLTGCTVAAEPPVIQGAKSFVTVAPAAGPAFSGTYDFDLLGEVQGQACATFGERRDATGWREVLVNGKSETYRVAGAGLANSGRTGGVLEQQAESAAVFDALNKLQGADMMFVTRARMQSRSSSEVCCTVWGNVARLKKGPTLGGELAPASAGPAAAPATPAPATLAPTSGAVLAPAR